eukprot:3219213-Pyramimonas_sp.AAC.2
MEYVITAGAAPLADEGMRQAAQHWLAPFVRIVSCNSGGCACCAARQLPFCLLGVGCHMTTSQACDIAHVFARVQNIYMLVDYGDSSAATRAKTRSSLLVLVSHKIAPADS